jgi:TonB family protein
MFDKLIETDTVGSEFKSRTRYFLVSTVAVGILFLSAVLISIFAAEYGIGTGEFDSARFLAPVIAESPEPVVEESSPANSVKENSLPTRKENMARVDEVQPTPTSVSVVQNTSKARPYGDYQILKNRNESDGGGNYRPGGTPNGTGVGSPSSETNNISDDSDIAIKPIPPIKRPEVPKTPRNMGVLNGKATSLPKPPYPQPAIKLNIQGTVTVQILIDEKGNVVSAKATSGHALLRAAAEKAAWNAKFSPTLLSKVPVKVTGVIHYNFTR